MHKNFPFNVLLFLHISKFHSVLPKAVFSPFFYISDSLHGLDCLHVEVSVILQRLVSFLFELKDSIVCEFFVVKFAGSLGPGELSGIVFGFEVTMAFGSAKTECFAVVPDEHYTMARVDWA